MTAENVHKAREWYAAHQLHVNKMLAVHGPQIEPSGSDVGRPELWKDIHWRWFMVGAVAKQLFNDQGATDGLASRAYLAGVHGADRGWHNGSVGARPFASRGCVSDAAGLR